MRAEFLRRMRRDPRQLVSLLRMARHPAVGLFLDEPPVKVLYGTDLGQVSQALLAIHPHVGIGGTAPNKPPRSPHWPIPMRPTGQCGRSCRSRPDGRGRRH